LEEARQHLPPAAKFAARLIGDRGITRDIDGDGVIVLDDLDGRDGWPLTGEFERQLVVPVQDRRADWPLDFAVLELDLPAARELAVANVDGDGARLEFAGIGLHILQ